MKSLNILISAYACNPYLGSEPQGGLNVISPIRIKMVPSFRKGIIELLLGFLNIILEENLGP